MRLQHSIRDTKLEWNVIYAVKNCFLFVFSLLVQSDMCFCVDQQTATSNQSTQCVHIFTRLYRSFACVNKFYAIANGLANGSPSCDAKHSYMTLLHFFVRRFSSWSWQLVDASFVHFIMFILIEVKNPMRIKKCLSQTPTSNNF